MYLVVVSSLKNRTPIMDSLQLVHQELTDGLGCSASMGTIYCYKKNWWVCRFEFQRLLCKAIVEPIVNNKLPYGYTAISHSPASKKYNTAKNCFQNIENDIVMACPILHIGWDLNMGNALFLFLFVRF